MPKAPRQQNWSLLNTVQGLKQSGPSCKADEQALTGALEHVFGEVQLALDTVMPIGLSNPST